MRVDHPSKNQTRKSGEIMRRARYEVDWLAAEDEEYERFLKARDMVHVYRRSHQQPMAKVRSGLTSMVTTIGVEPALTQRLKRTPRIVRKLQRSVGSPHGKTTLDRLEDIGGVRVILPDLEQIQRLADRIGSRWEVRRNRDYVAEPQPTGYWARHLVVVRDHRFIEVQIRTPRQQGWADAVEAADNRLHLTLKDGTGPESMVEYFALAAKQLRALELGHTVDSATLELFREARERVVREGFYSA